MKLVSFAIPSYNSEAYMEKCINSLLAGGEEVEIIIVNDGSKDRTREIADTYAAKYPSVVKAVHQENKGHGGAVNTGLKHATGLYYKVVDSDDWFDEGALIKYLAGIRKLVNEGITPDMIATNYVYEHVEDNSSKIMRYTNVFPEETVCTWEETKGLKTSQYLMMHAVTYRREMLLDCKLELPEHTFYVDNIYVYYPLPFVKTLYYMNIDLYRYFIGRSDQSVNESVMASRVDQQVKVTYIMLDCHDLDKIKEMSYVLYKNMFSSLSMMMVVSTIFLYIADGEENLAKKDKLWKYIKGKDQHLYAMLKYFSLNVISSFPGYQGRKLTVSLYRLAQKIYKFN
ncbi:MAG: glycosyltransferase [Clostridia bacterium]|nr:glycosyltransferase [Clostridia bacterium]